MSTAKLPCDNSRAQASAPFVDTEQTREDEMIGRRRRGEGTSVFGGGENRGRVRKRMRREREEAIRVQVILAAKV